MKIKVYYSTECQNLKKQPFMQRESLINNLILMSLKTKSIWNCWKKMHLNKEVKASILYSTSKSYSSGFNTTSETGCINMILLTWKLLMRFLRWVLATNQHNTFSHISCWLLTHSMPLLWPYYILYLMQLSSLTSDFTFKMLMLPRIGTTRH